MRREILVPLIVATALFMENVDATVISTSLPAISQDLKVDPIALKLALTSYLLSLAVFIPISGWMADRFGTRRVFLFAIFLFSLGSLLCALSPSLGALVGGRAQDGDDGRWNRRSADPAGEGGEPEAADGAAGAIPHGGQHPVGRDVLIGAAHQVHMVLGSPCAGQFRIASPYRPRNHFRSIQR